jgi:hypothetical protein
MARRPYPVTIFQARKAEASLFESNAQTGWIFTAIDDRP